MLLVFLLALFSFLLYLKGLAPSVYAGDSADIILASWFGGVAHPPGYPLNTMIGWVFTHLPYQAIVAYKANLMAAFLMSVVVGVNYLKVKKITKNLFVSITCALVLAFNPLFWLYAHTIEVFQLNLVLIASSVYFLFDWREAILAKKQKSRSFYLSILLLGLAVFHHQTSVLVVPAYFYLILKTEGKIFKNYKNILKILGFFSLGFLPYIFIPFAAMRQTPMNWDDPANLHNFIRLITRADYGTFSPANFIVGSDLKTRLIEVANFFLFVKADFKIIGLVIGIIGIIYTFARQRVIFWFTLLAIFFTGPFFLFYSGFPLANDFYTGLWERFLLLPYFFALIYIAFGLYLIHSVLARFFAINKFRAYGKLPTLAAGFFLVLLPAYLLVTNYDKTDLSKFYLGEWLAHDVLASAEPGSIVFVYGDTMAFNSQYLQYTDSEFKTMKIVKGASLYQRYYRDQVMREYPNLMIPENFYSNESNKDSSEYIKSFIISNVQQFPIYADTYFPEIESYRWAPTGLLKKLIPKQQYDKNMLLKTNEEKFSKFKYTDFAYDFGYEQYITPHIKENYYHSLIGVADELIGNGLKSEANKYLDKAVSLFPERKEAYFRLSNLAFLEDKCDEAKNYLERIQQFDKKDWRVLAILSDIHGECYKDEAKAKSFRDDADTLRRKVSDKPLESF